MKIAITLVFALLLNRAFAQDTIYWRADYKLEWEDFQGKADSNSPYGATSYPGIKYHLSIVQDSISVKVQCFFVKSKSWVRIISDTGLIHEQGHFDIAELFARKLRKAFAEYKFNTSTAEKDLAELFAVNKQERHQMDTLYDEDTDFSRNRKQQILWIKKIKSELDKLNQYASP